MQQTIDARDVCYWFFFVALVIGELKCNTKQLQQNLIFLNQVAFVKTREGSITSSNPAEPVEIFIYRAQPVCPVSVLLAYLNLKGSSPGPMFYWADLSSISRNFFTKALADSPRFCALDVSGYKSHSFRIGAASWAASQGLWNAQIRAFGRWKSNAFLRYIPAPSLRFKS